MKSERELIQQLGERIVRQLHLGQLRTGDRLPSMREIERETGIDARTVARVYRALEREGLVEVRGRSGVYVAEQERLGSEMLPEMAAWLTGVLVEAWKRMIRIPDLPELIRRSTLSTRLRCAVIESNEDSMTALVLQASESFGLDCRPVYLDSLPAHEPGEPVDADRLPAGLREADLVLTTPFHAGLTRAVAEALQRPLVVATANPVISPELERHLREGRVNAVVSDLRFAARLRSTYGGAYPDRLRVVLADDRDAIAALDPSKPVLLTDAARLCLGEVGPFRLVPHSPCISAESARHLAEMLIRLNLEAEGG
jgi:DNA-binding transcriptional regulator YhcF (GntR family)